MLRTRLRPWGKTDQKNEHNVANTGGKNNAGVTRYRKEPNVSSILKQMGSSAFLVATVLGASPTEAQHMPCAPRSIVVEELKTGYGEGPAGFGIQTSGQLIEIWAAPETGTWTVLMSLPNGSACVIASGTDWQHLNLQKPSVGVPS